MHHPARVLLRLLRLHLSELSAGECYGNLSSKDWEFFVEVLQPFLGDVDYRVVMAVTLLPMLVLVSVRNLKSLSPVSMFANLLQFTGLGIIFYYLLIDIPQVSERKYVAR